MRDTLFSLNGQDSYSENGNPPLNKQELLFLDMMRVSRGSEGCGGRDQAMRGVFYEYAKYNYYDKFISEMGNIDSHELYSFINANLEVIASPINDHSALLSHGRHDTEVRVIGGWWRVTEWEGYQFEIVQCPHSLPLILVGDSQEIVKSFYNFVYEALNKPVAKVNVFSEGHWYCNQKYDEEVLSVDWSDIILEGNQVEKIRRITDTFKNLKKDYKAMGLEWKRGILLTGPPGTGKTLLCKAIAKSVDLNVLYIKDLIGMRPPDSLIKTVFNKARELAPCVLIFEDIEGFMGDQSNSPVSRSVLLNEIDGFNSNDGILMIASSNHPERIDEALLKRPSRFDRTFEIGLPDNDTRRRYALYLMDNYIYGGYVHEKDNLAKCVADKTKDFSIPYIKEAFVQTALNVSDGKIDEEEFEVSLIETITELKRGLKRLDEAYKIGEFHQNNKAGFGSAND